MTQHTKKLSKPKLLLLTALLYTLLVTIAFLYPTVRLPQTGIPGSDKIVHTLIHAMLAFIWLYYSFSADKYHISNSNIFVVLIGCFLYGFAIEVSQHLFTLSRQFDLFDLLANLIGSIIGLLAFWMFKRKNFQ